jgi:hypothetical protein
MAQSLLPGRALSGLAAAAGSSWGGSTPLLMTGLLAGTFIHNF